MDGHSRGPYPTVLLWNSSSGLQAAGDVRWDVLGDRQVTPRSAVIVTITVIQDEAQPRLCVGHTHMEPEGMGLVTSKSIRETTNRMSLLIS